MKPCVFQLLVVAGLLWPASGTAQQATDSPAAVQPGKGQWAVRQLVRYDRYDDANTRNGRGQVDQVIHETVAAYGLARNWAAMVHVPLLYREFFENIGVVPDSDLADGFGVGDLNLMLQHRFWQSDQPGTDTARAVLLGGVEVPSGDADFSTGSFDPFVGVAYTQISGRHGLNATAVFKVNTGGLELPVRFDHGPDDSVRLDGSYLYRLAPGVYTAQTTGSAYAQVQVLGRYETNGDTEVLVAPGYLYEAPGWAFEATVRLALLQSLDERPEVDVGLTLGLRFLF